MLLDTTFLIDLQRELAGAAKRGASAFLEKHAAARLSISLVTWMELAEGYTDVHADACRMFLSRFPLIVPDTAIAWRASRISRSLRNQGAPIGDHDSWVAATAIERALPLVTRNVRHFRRVDDLDVLTY